MVHFNSLFLSLLIILTSYSFLGFSQSIHSKKWILKKNKCGIKVWTQNVIDSSIDRYKVEGIVEAQPQEIIKALMDFPQFHKWHDGIKIAKKLKQIDKNKVLAYMELDFPWPTQNRDSYAYSEVIQSGLETKIMITQLKKEFQTKNTRVAKSEGFWLIEPTAQGVMVSQQLHAEPGGSLPDWIVNTMITKGPYNTLKGLRRFLGAKECY